MAEIATAPTQTRSTPSLTLGSFKAGPRIVNPTVKSDSNVNLEVTGSPETRFAGLKAFARCFVLVEDQLERTGELSIALARLGSLEGPSLIPVLETGISGRIAFTIEATVDGERLSSRLEREHRLPPLLVAMIVSDIGDAVGVANHNGLHHGELSAFSVWIDEKSRSRVGGFGLNGRDAAYDVEHVARLAIELLAGTPLNAAPGEPVTVDRVRGHVNGLTELVALAIAPAFDSNGPANYDSVGSFAEAFSTAVKHSGSDLVAGAWEAVERGDLPMAEILADMVSGYDPGSRELPLLRLKFRQSMQKDSPAAATQLMEMLQQRSTVPAPAREITHGSLIEGNPALSSPPELPPDISRLLQNSVAKPPKTATHYWALFAVGIFAMIIVMVVIGAFIFSRT